MVRNDQSILIFWHGIARRIVPVLSMMVVMLAGIGPLSMIGHDTLVMILTALIYAWAVATPGHDCPPMLLLVLGIVLDMLVVQPAGIISLIWVILSLLIRHHPHWFLRYHAFGQWLMGGVILLATAILYGILTIIVSVHILSLKPLLHAMLVAWLLLPLMMRLSGMFHDRVEAPL